MFYAVFYTGSALFVLTAVIALALAPDRMPQVADNWSRFHRACVKRILAIRVTITGSRPLGPALYALRHESFFEAIDLPTLLDRPVGFAKQELYAIPGWGRAAAAYGMVPVARRDGARALRAMIRETQRLAGSERPVAIFPEGTRVAHDQRAPIQAGFTALYKALGRPVVPVAVNSGPLYHRRWKRAGTIEIRFGAPIEPGLPRAEIEARVVDAINALNPPVPDNPVRSDPASHDPATIDRAAGSAIGRPPS